MRNGVLVLGCDGGLATYGWALVRLYPRHEEVVGMGVFTTAASDKKQHVLVADDTFRRSRELARELESLTSLGAPVCAVCYEGLSLPRNAASANKIGWGLGVLASFAERHALPVCCVSPQGLKKAVVGSGSATKAEVATALARKFSLRAVEPHGRKSRVLCNPDRPDPLRDVKASLHEHAWDALGSVVACLDSDVIRAVRVAA